MQGVCQVAERVRLAMNIVKVGDGASKRVTDPAQDAVVLPVFNTHVVASIHCKWSELSAYSYTVLYSWAKFNAGLR
jgi:hypothetical protein